MKKNNVFTILFIAQIFLFISCSSDSDDSIDTTEEQTETETTAYVETYEDSDFEATDWTDATHSKSADPNFEEVFSDTEVKRLDLVITEERWQAMLDDMTANYGEFGTSVSAGPGAGGPPAGNGLVDTDEDPIFVPGDVYYEGKEWYRVGLRFKGNSSLQSTWSNGNLKLSFKLDFDEFEDEYPQIDNQRFYGFKKLSLKNNYNDKSMLREKVAADVFTAAGVVSSHTAFYAVYVDYGDGPVYFGLYTMVEEVDDTVIDTQFADNDGNLYKPDGDGASFADGSFTEDVFVKKTNEDDEDYTDILSIFEALHAENRTTDSETWRTNLESVFDTDMFLKYLAVNTVIQNWDTYGRMTHNYFLYNNPDTEKLQWIPWDNNEALQNGNMQGSLALDFSDVNSTEWPLIGYLYADDIYKATYNAYVQDVVDNAFNTSTMQSKYANYASLIEPYATTELEGHTFLNSSADFYIAVDELKNHVSERATAVQNYLN
ncbi:CotH protein [Cellulophaga sp. RHA_52]|uniref:CotH kinase family protein n=1 Tax=Cellulophaga TaxID=104264 RepID=UPI0004F64F42|nr:MULTISPECIES: CotH kinase family protein [Cellulophaga]AIM61678.1 spore coat protein [Cellulophaga lytica]APU11576.1 spore coat protein [Cellulophaga lytica]TVZ09992.1 CotH protein [Cellulophaga sp. RHA_52]